MNNIVIERENVMLAIQRDKERVRIKKKQKKRDMKLVRASHLKMYNKKESKK